MKASMGQRVKELLSGDRSARVLTAAVITGSRHSDTIRIEGALPNGQVLTLKRISLKDR